MSGPAKRRTKRSVSPAARALRANGSTVSHVAILAGVDQSEASRMLRGDRPLAPRVIEAISKAVGPEAMIDIVNLVPNSRAITVPLPTPRTPGLLERLVGYIRVVTT